MPVSLAIRVDLAHPDHTRLVQRRLLGFLPGRLRISTDDASAATVRLVSLDQVPSQPPRESVVAVGDAELVEIVRLMSARPWLDHVVTPRVLEGGAWGSCFEAAIWKLLTHGRMRGSIFFGSGFQGRQVRIRDSAKRERRLETIADLARTSGSSSATVARIRDIAEELITNALYDAPAEARRTPADRTSRVVLPPERACTITYGVADQTFFLRVRDQYGSLRRNRLVQVLSRCAQLRDVSFDVSRGGAGLGLWRIFSGSSLVLVEVNQKKTTSFLVGIDMRRGRRSGRGRAIHLFFDGSDQSDSDDYADYEMSS